MRTALSITLAEQPMALSTMECLPFLEEQADPVPTQMAPRPAKGVVDQPVERDLRRAVSRYEVLGRSGPLALVRFDIETGRLHQVRLHAKALGHPVVGDPEHGDAAADRRLRARPSRMMLHAVELSFLHPTTHRRVTFVAPPPAALAAVALA